jgi:predicted nucleic acid binding AN1-type Zn finger protein
MLAVLLEPLLAKLPDIQLLGASTAAVAHHADTAVRAPKLRIRKSKHPQRLASAAHAQACVKLEAFAANCCADCKHCGCAQHL